MSRASELFVVATPIGNLQDITLRALDTLKEVDYIISEDTRITNRLLDHFHIKKTQISYRDENRHKAIPKIIDLFQTGCAMALVTDSGTPLISDPGFKLIEALVRENIKITPIPGASAIITALSASGVPTDKFAFVGFLPKKGGERNAIIEKYGTLDSTFIIYESPYRVEKTLLDIQKLLGDRYVCVAKEITKIYETFYRGKISEVLAQVQGKRLKGEYVILVAKEGYDGD